jgi:hypothetical protein
VLHHQPIVNNPPESGRGTRRTVATYCRDAQAVEGHCDSEVPSSAHLAAFQASLRQLYALAARRPHYAEAREKVDAAINEPSRTALRRRQMGETRNDRVGRNNQLGPVCDKQGPFCDTGELQGIPKRPAISRSGLRDARPRSQILMVS